MSGEDLSDVEDEVPDPTATARTSLWKDPRKFILTVLVGALLGLFEAILGQLFGAGAAVRQALEEAGVSVMGALGDVADLVLRMAAYPFGALETVAASAGPLAPLAVALLWAILTAAVVAGLYVLWRVVTWI